MGKQYNKVMKRRRRVAYLARRKEAINELVSSKPKASTKSKPAKAKPAKKSSTKKEKLVEAKPEPVAEKADPTDVLGDNDLKQDESSDETTSKEGDNSESKEPSGD